MTADGNTIIISNLNYARVYENNGGNWTQIGSNILLNYIDVVCISGDGGTIAISSSTNDEMGNKHGKVMVFQNIVNNWIQVGSALYGDYDYAFFGHSVDLSYDGSVLAVGSAFNFPTTGNVGQVDVYRNNSNSWDQIGNSIIGDEIDDSFGYSLALDSTGNNIVIGAIFSNEIATYCGQVKVFCNISENWVQIGNNILGEAFYNRCGISVSINNDGSVIAVGEMYNNAITISDPGQVKIYRNISSNWVQIGNTLVGDNSDDNFSNSICLNADGSIIVIGAPNFDSTGEKKGQVKVFKNISDNWVQIRQDLYGEYDGNNNGESFGYSVHMSDNGYSIIVGHPYNDEVSANSGKVTVYEYSCDDVYYFNLVTADSIICPDDTVTLNAGSGFDTYLWNIGCTDSLIMTSDTGWYFVTVSGFECGENTDSIYMVNGITPNIELIPDTSICANTPLTLDAGSHTSFLWSTGDTSQFITVSDSGNYTVTVTSISCSNTDSVYIEILDLPDIDLFSDTVICPYDSIIIDAGTWSSYLWSTGSNEQIISPGSAGFYSVTVSNENSCFNSDTVNIIHSINPTGVDDTISICLNGEYSIVANPINDNTWNSIYFSDTISYIFVHDTIFYLEAIDTSNCIINDTIYLIIDSNFIVLTGLNDTLFACTDNEILIIANTDNENIWNSVLNSDTITYIASNDTTFFLYATDPIGCEQTDSIHISILDNTNSLIDTSVCDTYSSPSGNYIWANSGTYFDTIPNSIGCDSILTINLIVNNSTSMSINPVACESYASPSGNYVWENSGIYMDTLINTAGCDSIIIVNLTINNTHDTIFTTSCNSYTSPSGLYIWQNTGIYLDTISNSLGCDSIILIELTINNNTSSTINPEICANELYFSPSGNFIWTDSGTYLDTIPNDNGCDSVITINLLQLSTPYVNLGDDITISENQSVLIGNGYNLPNYLWSTGDTTPTIVIEGNIIGIGVYYYWLYSEEANECSDIDTMIITITYGIGIDDINNANAVKVYPNPTNGKFFVDIEEFERIDILNIMGKKLIETNNNEIDISRLSAGIYFIKILTDKGTTIRRLIKE